MLITIYLILLPGVLLIILTHLQYYYTIHAHKLGSHLICLVVIVIVMCTKQLMFGYIIWFWQALDCPSLDVHCCWLVHTPSHHHLLLPWELNPKDQAEPLETKSIIESIMPLNIKVCISNPMLVWQASPFTRERKVLVSGAQPNQIIPHGKKFYGKNILFCTGCVSQFQLA